MGFFILKLELSLLKLFFTQAGQLAGLGNYFGIFNFLKIFNYLKFSIFLAIFSYKGGQKPYFLIQNRHFRPILPTPHERSARNTYSRLKKSVSRSAWTDFMVQNMIFRDFS